jgi:DNA-binding MarR family transcriptional regulator
MTQHPNNLSRQQHQLFHEIFVLLDDGDRRTLAALELTPLEFALLERLDPQVGRRLTDVGVELLCVKSTITRLVDRLEANGLVQRLPDPEDRRAQRITLTSTGVAVRRSAEALHHSSIERRLNALEPTEQRTLIALLEKLRTGLQQTL